MKLHSFFILLNILLVSTCGKNQNNTDAESKNETSQNVSPKEKNLMDSIEFNLSILKRVRKFSHSPIKRIISYNDVFVDSIKSFVTNEIPEKGFRFETTEKIARETVISLINELRNEGYLIYISETHFGYDPDVVSILKSEDQFDILRVEDTNGTNYGIENDHVISKLQEWHEKYPFIIYGADIARVEATFIKEPENMKRFAKEVYKFCPDIVDQGTGTLKELEKEIANSGQLYLWWD